MEPVMWYNDNDGGNIDEFILDGNSINEVFKDYGDKIVKDVKDFYDEQCGFLEAIENYDFKNIIERRGYGDENFDEDEEEGDCAPGMETYWIEWYSSNPIKFRKEVIELIVACSS